jgi:thiamine biosynthesis lipoprotein
MRRVLVPLDLPPVVRASVPRDASVHELQGETMGTTWSVKLVAPARHSLHPVRERIERTLDLVVAQMSTWIAESDISRFNRAAAGTWCELPAEFHEVLKYSLAVSEETSGAFDPAAGAMVDLWGFGPAGPRNRLPSADEIVAARCERQLKLASGRRALQPGGVKLDLSGVAKGFAVDLVSEQLGRLGLNDHLVEIGGELRGSGTKPDGSPWWVVLEGPAETVVALHGLSVATSGDSERYFEIGGRRFSHTIDPRSGYPVPQSMQSVTVLHRRCICADALATALMVLGLDAGLEYAERRGLAARFIVRNPSRPREHATSAFTAMLN